MRDLGQAGLQNTKIMKKLRKPMLVEGVGWPKRGPKGLPEVFCNERPLQPTVVWDHVGFIMVYLMASLALFGGSEVASGGIFRVWRGRVDAEM